MNTNFIFAILSIATPVNSALAGKESTRRAEAAAIENAEPENRYEGLRDEVARTTRSTYELLTFSAPVGRKSGRDERW